MSSENFDKSIYRSRTAELRRANNLKERQLNSFEKNSKERALRQAQREKQKQLQRSNSRVHSVLSRSFLTYLVAFVFAIVVLAGGQPNYRPDIVSNETIPTYTTENGAEFLDFSNYNPLDNAYSNSSPSVSIPRLSFILDGVSVLSNSAPTIDSVSLDFGEPVNWGDWGAFNWLRNILFEVSNNFVNFLFTPVNGCIQVINFVVDIYEFLVSYA